MSRIDRAELRQICVLFGSVVYTWLIITYEGTQKGSKLSSIQRIQYCFNDDLSNMNVNFSSNSPFQSQSIFVYEVEVIQELDHSFEGAEKT